MKLKRKARQGAVQAEGALLSSTSLAAKGAPTLPRLKAGGLLASHSGPARDLPNGVILDRKGRSGCCLCKSILPNVTALAGQARR